jgi:hypothetical protein
MRATPLLVATATAIVLGAAADLSARWGDEAAIRQTVQYYFDGGTNRDSVALRKAFHPDARMLFAKDQKLWWSRSANISRGWPASAPCADRWTRPGSG